MLLYPDFVAFDRNTLTIHFLTLSPFGFDIYFSDQAASMINIKLCEIFISNLQQIILALFPKFV